MFTVVGLHGPPPHGVEQRWSLAAHGARHWVSQLCDTTAGGPFERLEVSCFGDSYRWVNTGLCVYSWWAAAFGGPLGRLTADYLDDSRWLLGNSWCSGWVFIVTHMQKPVGMAAVSARSGDSHGLHRGRQFDRWHNFDWWFSSWMSWSEFVDAARRRGFCRGHPESESEQIDVGHSGDYRCLPWTWSWTIFFYGCYIGSTQHDRLDMRMTYCTDLIYRSGLSHFIWPMGRRGVFDVCETWCRDGEADVPLLADVQGRIPERMTWWGERWHRDSTPTNVKKERAWECFTGSGTPVVATHFYMLSCAPICHGSDHSADEGFQFFVLETRLLRSATTNSADTELIMSSGPSPPKPLARI